MTWLQSDFFLSPFLFQLPGKILTDDFADKEGLEMGDEYFANLDHIESVENFKEGYESEAHCSDSEGSGVDMSRLKIQPSALVSSNPVGRPPKKGESKSKGERSVFYWTWGDSLWCVGLTPADILSSSFSTLLFFWICRSPKPKLIRRQQWRWWQGFKKWRWKW